MMMSLLSSLWGKKRDEATKMIKKTKKSFSNVFHSLSSLSLLFKISLSFSLVACVCVCACAVTAFLKEREERASLSFFFAKRLLVARVFPER